jgi:hypothetical protein
MSELSGGISNNWIARTYYIFHRAGYPVSLSSRLEHAAINIVATDTFGRRDRQPHPFVAAVRGDFHDCQLANFVIEQNFLGPPRPRHAGIYHWPQPGLVPRDRERGARLETVVFKGHDCNLDQSFRDPAFLRQLDRLGMRLVIDAREKVTGKHRWHDFEAADAVLAVRNLTEADARVKPASKLVNAWFAEVPAILGPEPAFQDIRRSALDYIEVTSPQEALDALERLKSDPALYRAMVENGRARRSEFTEAEILRRWVDLLNGPIFEAYTAWHRKALARKAAEIGLAFVKEPFAKRRHARDIRVGRRILR